MGTDFLADGAADSRGEHSPADLSRRFGGIVRLYGAAGFARIAAARVMVVGVGGVGSWAVEALARSGVGRLTLVDMDVLAESNINRQLPALGSTLGELKAGVMAARCRDINPQMDVQVVDDFLTPANLPGLLAESPTLVIDCIDDLPAKVALAVYCRQHKIPLLLSGGAGGRVDPTRIRVADLSRTTGDALLSKLRQRLRKQHRIAVDPGKKFGLTCVYSEEPSCRPTDCVASGLQCGGYGSITTVTATVGLTLVSEALKKITRMETARPQ